MSRYEERLQQDLTRIREAVETVSQDVQTQLERAMHALMNGDKELAYQTILGDLPINRTVRRIDALCHAFIAQHLPGAGHLRAVSSVIRINIELERIGDYAASICRQAVCLSRPPDGTLVNELSLMSEQARTMLERAGNAFYLGNADAAREIMPVASQVSRSFDIAFDTLVSDETRPQYDLFCLLVICNMLDRVSDQAKNICEETVFAVTGETKAAKVYRVLFLDRSNSCQSQMAEAIARKSFPTSGEFTSAGSDPAAELDPGMVRFMEDHGIDLGDAHPHPIDHSAEVLDRQHVVVSLDGPAGTYLKPVPFHTVALEWQVDAPPDYEEIYRELAERIRELMLTLRGEEAR